MWVRFICFGTWMGALVSLESRAGEEAWLRAGKFVTDSYGVSEAPEFSFKVIWKENREALTPPCDSEPRAFCFPLGCSVGPEVLLFEPKFIQLRSS